MTKGSRVVVLLAITVGTACRSDADEARLGKLEARIGALEADLGGRLAPPPPSAGESTLSGLESRIAKLEALNTRMADLESKALTVSRVPLQEDKTGNELCADRKETCLSVIISGDSSLVDANNVFCGHMVADCNSRVVRRDQCLADANYVASPVQFWKTPNAKGHCPNIHNETCVVEPSRLVAICLHK